MRSVSPAQLTEIFPLRLKAREEMRFTSSGGKVLAERVADGQRFFFKVWQYEMMRRFDGSRTFEEIAREVYDLCQGGFSTVGLTNFYFWLYEENLVSCECESIFELVVEDEETDKKASSRMPEFREESESRMTEKMKGLWKESFGPQRDWQRQALKMSAILLFSLAVLRIAYVAAPILEPPVNLFYASVEGYFDRDATRPEERRAETEVRETPVRELALAGRAQSDPANLPAPPVAEVVPYREEMIPEPVRTEAPTFADVEQLRREMAECRIRRDEFYLQNNEIGYRYEVQKMTALAKEIGEIEALLD